MDQILKYFPEITEQQESLLSQLMSIYGDWNLKINLISRKDFDHFYERHVLHSLAIAKAINLKNGTEVLDFGTGGGFPGIPLAIWFPNVSFTLIDSIGKKIKVVKDVAEKLNLNNVEALNIRGEQLDKSFDFVVSRAVTDLPTFSKWVNYRIRKKGFNDLKNGVLYLKGGDILQELLDSKKHYRLFPLSDFFTEEFFDTKYLVHLFD